MIKIEKLNKYYNQKEKNELHVLKDLNLEVKNQEYISIMGTSGVGKSTLLNIVGLNEGFQNGKYYINEANTEEFDDDELSNLRGKFISYVYQNFLLIEEDSILENIMTPLYFDNSIRMKDMKKKAIQSIKKVGLQDIDINKSISKLSGGQKQRVAIARAIVTNPHIILADEPTGSLDEKSTLEILDLFRKLNKSGIAIILVTHDLDVAKNADKIYELSEGNLKLIS